MIRILFLLMSVCLSGHSLAQNTKIQLTKVKQAGKQDDFTIYQVQFTVISGEVKDRIELNLVRNGAIKSYAQLSLADNLTAGQSTRFDEVLSVIGAPITAGQTLVSHDVAIPSLPSNRNFSFKTGTAFLGDTPKEFFATISDSRGICKVGDRLVYRNAKGQQDKGRIISITVAKTLHPTVLLEGLPSSVPVTLGILSDNNSDFSNATVTSAGGMAVETASTQPATDKTTNVTGKTRTIPTNAVLQNDEVKITVHNLIKFNPDPSNSQYDAIKVDYTLDYYVVDATVENTATHDIDAGEYLLRLNFFSSDGKSADEFLRVFRKQNDKNDDTQKQADGIDTMVFGGTSKIKTSAVLAKYQEMIPDYQQTQKPIVDALSKKMAPGQKLHSIVATMLAVPPTYRIEGLGTWKGTFYSKKNLLFVPIRP